MKWFGPSWHSPLNRECEEMPVPIGLPCEYCGEVFIADDQGIRLGSGELEHIDCFLCGVFGSAAHQQRTCSCYVPGSTEHDPPGMTKRQAATAAVNLWNDRMLKTYKKTDEIQ